MAAKVGGGMLLSSLFAGLHAAWGIRRMRRRAAHVAALEHTIDLPGRFPPRVLVMLGDSAAAGHGLSGPDVAVPRLVGRGLVDRDGRATAVRSVALDGATTAEVLTTQVGAARGAEVVLIGVGANDALNARHTRGEIVDTTHRLLAAVAEVASPGARVILHNSPDLSAAPGLPSVLRPIVGWRCRRVAQLQAAVAALHGVPVVDMPREKLPPEVFGADGFHPGPEGHARLAARVLRLLVESPSETGGRSA